MMKGNRELKWKDDDDGNDLYFAWHHQEIVDEALYKKVEFINLSNYFGKKSVSGSMRPELENLDPSHHSCIGGIFLLCVLMHN
jgi:hypothetical protein